MKRELVGAALALAVFGWAGPVDDYRTGTDFSLNMESAAGNVSGILSFPVSFTGGGWNPVAKPSGSLNGTISLLALAPALGLDANGILTGKDLGNNRLQWTLTAPDVIDKFVDITYDGTSYHVKIKSVSGTLTTMASNVFPVLDPAGAGLRNVDLSQDAGGTNVIVVKAQLNGSIFLPVTVTLDELVYSGLAGFAPVQTVSGKVTLGDFVGAVAGKSVTVELRPPGSTTVLESHVVSLGADGAYSFWTTSWGEYDLVFKSSHWLRAVLPKVNLDGSRSSVDVTLANGDVDGDNAVTVFDYNALSAAFDSAPGDSNWNSDADIDGDGSVTVFDYNVLSANFDMVGMD